MICTLSYFDTCINYIKGKLPTKAKMGKKSKKQEGLELIHLNISGPIHPTSMRCYNYFITFIDDYFTFGWVVTHRKK